MFRHRVLTNYPGEAFETESTSGGGCHYNHGTGSVID